MVDIRESLIKAETNINRNIKVVINNIEEWRTKEGVTGIVVEDEGSELQPDINLSVQSLEPESFYVAALDFELKFKNRMLKRINLIDEEELANKTLGIKNNRPAAGPWYDDISFKELILRRRETFHSQELKENEVVLVSLQHYIPNLKVYKFKFRNQEYDLVYEKELSVCEFIVLIPGFEMGPLTRTQSIRKRRKPKQNEQSFDTTKNESTEDSASGDDSSASLQGNLNDSRALKSVTQTVGEIRIHDTSALDDNVLNSSTHPSQSIEGAVGLCTSTASVTSFREEEFWKVPRQEYSKRKSRGRKVRRNLGDSFSMSVHLSGLDQDTGNGRSQTRNSGRCGDKSRSVQKPGVTVQNQFPALPPCEDLNINESNVTRIYQSSNDGVSIRKSSTDPEGKVSFNTSSPVSIKSGDPSGFYRELIPFGSFATSTPDIDIPYDAIPKPEYSEKAVPSGESTWEYNAAISRLRDSTANPESEFNEVAGHPRDKPTGEESNIDPVCSATLELKGEESSKDPNTSLEAINELYFSDIPQSERDTVDVGLYLSNERGDGGALSLDFDGIE